MLTNARGRRGVYTAEDNFNLVVTHFELLCPVYTQVSWPWALRCPHKAHLQSLLGHINGALCITQPPSEKAVAASPLVPLETVPWRLPIPLASILACHAYSGHQVSHQVAPLW